MSQLTTINNSAFAMDDDEPVELENVLTENVLTETELRQLFLNTIWTERENILRFVAGRTPEQLQTLNIGTLLDMMVGSVLTIIDGLNPMFPALDLTAYPLDGETYMSADGEEKMIDEDGTIVNDNFLGEAWESLVLGLAEEPSQYEDLNEPVQPTVH
ncbi:hypothetical protein [Companilactobacillus sp.]|uniref:hypothetical protein n=1 Tax=Companilactobacillus sp. TaxID=2767905 RepID=UPI00261032DE|nr:hypothetical protein [Companilactobacillus sp.]